MKMAMEIGNASKAADYVNQKRAAKEPVMGFGHRVYRAVDAPSRHAACFGFDAMRSGEPCRARCGMCHSRRSAREVHRLVQARAPRAGTRFRRDRRPVARQARGTVVPRLLRQLPFLAAVRVGEHPPRNALTDALRSTGSSPSPQTGAVCAACTRQERRGLSACYDCIPQRRTVRSSTLRKTTFSTNRPIRITVNKPAKTFAISRSFLLT